MVVYLKEPDEQKVLVITLAVKSQTALKPGCFPLFNSYRINLKQAI